MLSPWTCAVIALVTLGAVVPLPVVAGSATVLYADRVTQVEKTLEDPTDLWVPPGALPSINGFVLKPEGACLDELCVPVKQDEDSELLVSRQGEKWFNVTQLAKNLKQPYAAAYERRVYSFGAIPATQSSYLESAVAPDFALPDRQGNVVRLSDFRGKKVLLLTWASW